MKKQHIETYGKGNNVQGTKKENWQYEFASKMIDTWPSWKKDLCDENNSSHISHKTEKVLV